MEASIIIGIVIVAIVVIAFVIWLAWQIKKKGLKEFATEKYSEVDKPFQLYSGLSRDAFDYIELYIFILSI